MQDVATAAIEQANESVENAHVNQLGEQYLTFFMNKEEFGVNILSVQEIRGWEDVTPIPNAPEQIKGVMNLRGTIAPVIDLRMCFGLPRIDYTNETVVIILAISSEEDSKTVGIVVDAVSDVHHFDDNAIQPSPELSHEAQAKYIKGLGATEEQMVILLNLNEHIIEDVPL